MKKILEEIENEIPLECSYEEDARYHWPKRWNELKKRLKADQHETIVMQPIYDKNGREIMEKWKAVERFTGWQIEDENGFVIAKEINRSSDMGESDAKLISACNEMKDALIDAKKCVGDKTPFEHATFSKIEEALQKAGISI